MYVNRKNPHGGDIYSHEVLLDLSSNMNPAGMPDEVKTAVRASAESCAGYPDPYCRELRKAISEREGVPDDCIICGNGAAELIYSYAYSLPKDRHALVVSPTFSEYEDALNATGITVDHYLLRETEGFRLTEDILKEDLSGYCAVFLCTPNNPTGITVDPKLLEEIAGTGVRLFCDMCFLDLTEDPDRYGIPSFIERHANVTVLKAFTKSFSMAGLRLGYAMTSDSELLEMMSSKTQCWNVSSVAQQAGIAALGCAGWLRESVVTAGKERARLADELTALGIKVWPSEANYLLLRTDTDLYGEMIKHRILIRDCSNYTGLENGYYRIAVKTAEENDIFLTALKEIIR